MRNINYGGPHQNMWLGPGKFFNSLSGQSNVTSIFNVGSKFRNPMSGLDPMTEGLVTMTQTKPGSS
jgi:hypothetical protein